MNFDVIKNVDLYILFEIENDVWKYFEGWSIVKKNFSKYYSN